MRGFEEHECEREREHGRIKFVNREKGYFFIIPDSPTPAQHGDVFGHISQVRDQAFINLAQDSRVSYLLRRSTRADGRLEAHDIKLEKSHDRHF